MADVDGDGRSEYFIHRGALYAIDDDGSVMWTQEPIDITPAYSSPALHDFYGDGFPELVYLTTRSIEVLDAWSGELLDYAIIPRVETWAPLPALVDLDGDGSREILAAAAEGIVTRYETDEPPGSTDDPAPWTGIYSNPYRQGARVDVGGGPSWAATRFTAREPSDFLDLSVVEAELCTRESGSVIYASIGDAVGGWTGPATVSAWAGEVLLASTNVALDGPAQTVELALPAGAAPDRVEVRADDPTLTDCDPTNDLQPLP